MDRATIILLTLVVYQVVLLAIGLIAERRTKNEADFLIGGRQLGPFVAALSASASSSSVWTLLGVSGYAYLYGLPALWLLPACIGGFAINWYLIAPRLRERAADADALTLTDLLAGRDRGPGFATVRIVGSLILLVGFSLYVGAQFNGAGKSFASNFDLSLEASILIGSAIVVAYTLLGGFWAVSLTDTLQGTLMALTALALPIAALVAVGGFGALGDGLAAVDVDGFTSVWPRGDGLAPLGTVLVLLAIAAGYPGQPHVVNRFMALGDAAAVRTARRYALGWAFAVYPGMIVLGLCARVHLDLVAPDNETVFFTMMNELFSPVIAGVMFAAVLSAIMSTADSQLLVAGSAVSHDIGLRGADERQTLLRSRAVVLAVAVVAVLTALYGSKAIFDTVLIAFTAVGAAFGPLLVVTLWRGPVGPGRSLAAMLTGFSVTALAYAFPQTRSGVAERVLPYVLASAVIVRSQAPSFRKNGPGQ